MSEQNPLRWLEDIAYELNLIRKNLDEFVRIWKNDLDRVEKKLEELEHDQ
jgi:acyl transferase domain-containing protein